MRADRKRNRFYRLWILIMWLLPLPFLIRIVIETGLFVPLFVQVIWTVPIYILLSFYKKVILTEQGIYSYTLVKGKCYPWDKIIQAGVLWRIEKTSRYNEFVLLKQGGHPRKHRDDLFLPRNVGRVIRMDDTPEIRSYVRKYYGLLDFDLADGKREKSQVDEELSQYIPTCKK